MDKLWYNGLKRGLSMMFGFFYLVCIFSTQLIHGYTTFITQPGEFSIGGNIELGGNEIGFYIQADNVILNLNSYSVGRAQNTSPLIVVAANCNNVAIKNGTLLSTNSWGIVVEDGCSTVHIENIQIQNCLSGGILFAGTSTGTGIKNGFIYNTEVISCAGQNTSAAYGICMINTKDTLIENVATSYIDAVNTSSCHGTYLEHCSGCEIFNCKSSANGAAHMACGYSFVNCHNCILRDTITNSNKTYLDNSCAYGVYLQTSTHTLCLRVISSDNLGEVDHGIGFYTHLGTRNVFDECVAQSNRGGKHASGFELETENMSTLFRSISRSTQTLLSGSACGICLTNTCINVSIRENTVMYTTGIDGSYGIHDTYAPSTSLVVRNYAYGNGTNYSINYTGTYIIPVITAHLSTGIPAGIPGVLDNLDLNP